MKHRTRALTVPSLGELESLGTQKYGPVESMGWSPARRRKFRYYLPADVYESLVAKAVEDGMRWLDVGGGHSIFPENPSLARALVSRCAKVVAVDPSDNVLKNTFAHEAARSPLEAYEAPELFDLATIRMVVEHVADPESFVGALSRLVRPGGVVIVFTVNLWSPVTILSRILPFKTHHALKRIFWGGEEEDTFPVCYKMNSRPVLARLFQQAGFAEELFVPADDLSVFGNLRWLSHAELLAWKGLRAVGLPYPERCLLAVYRKQPPVA